MSVSGPTKGLRPLLLPPRISPPKQSAPYQPKISRGDPTEYYEHKFSSNLDVMTSVGVRRHIVYSAPLLYAIRKYPVKRTGESPHPIEELMQKFRNCKSIQLRHLLMPIQSFLHVDDRSFFTVSEYAFMTLRDVLQCLKQCRYMMCHDDIWSIVKQVLSGIESLAMFRCQHNELSLHNILITRDGIVKVGGIHEIIAETSNGRDIMSNALKQLIESLIKHGSDPCSHCVDAYCSICNANTKESCCDGAYMIGQIDSIISAIDKFANQQSTLVEIIRTVKSIDFISQAQGLRLHAVVDFASAKGWRDMMPEIREPSSSEQKESKASGTEISLVNNQSAGRSNKRSRIDFSSVSARPVSARSGRFIPGQYRRYKVYSRRVTARQSARNGDSITKSAVHIIPKYTRAAARRHSPHNCGALPTSPGSSNAAFDARNIGSNC